MGYVQHIRPGSSLAGAASTVHVLPSDRQLSTTASGEALNQETGRLRCPYILYTLVPSAPMVLDDYTHHVYFSGSSLRDSHTEVCELTHRPCVLV